MRFLRASLVAFAAIVLSAAPGPKGSTMIALQSAPVFASNGRVSDPAAGESITIERFARQAADQAGAFIETEGGSSVLLLRFTSSGARAVRLHIGNMRLPEGSRLFVYGMRDGVATNVAGPYEGSGPALDDDFWTDAVSGSEAVVELQADGERPADLPFQVLELAWVDLEEVPAAPRTDKEVRTSEYRGMVLTHEVDNGVAVFERDIILGPADELLPPAKYRRSTRDAVAITGARYRWPGGVIPYVIDAAVPSQARIVNAVNHWNTALSGHVRMVPRTTEVNYVGFQRASSAGTCSSTVGMAGIGRQAIQVGDNCSTGNLIHEIGHAFGLWHEQSREDRDKFVRILWDNIQTAQKYNFSQQISMGDDIGAYDYGSIMHYNAYSFSVNGQPTIETIPAGIPLGQRTGLSSGDIAAIRNLYPLASGGTTPAPTVASVNVTVTTNPTGLPIVVDGVGYTSPRTFIWPLGSAHMIGTSAPASTTVRYTYQGWSDGGAQTHPIAVSSATSIYKADYAVAYLVQASATTPGTITAAPLSSDSYYPSNSTLVLNATAPTGYCFTGWTGLLAGTPPNTGLTITKPYSIHAGFKPGSVTAGSSLLKAPAAGGQITLGVNATSGCLWNAASYPSSWLKVISGASGSGPGVVTISAAANTGTVSRTGLVVVGNGYILVSQPVR
jgi:hypothetical protein